MFAGKGKKTAQKFHLVEINPAQSTFLYRYLPPEKCYVSVDLSLLALYKIQMAQGGSVRQSERAYVFI